MSSTIGNLVHGAPAQATDQIPIQRGTTQNFKLLVSDITALVPPTTLTWAGLTGDLTETQVIPWDGPTVGTSDTSLSRISAGLIGVGTGAQGSHAGSLSMANITVSGTTSFAAASIAVAALSADTIGLTDSTGLFTVTGSPATLGGSLTLSAFASQSQNYVLAGPATGGAGAAAFRAIVSADIPSTIVLASGITAVTQPPIDNSTLIATDAFVQTAVELSMATVPLSITGGTYSFASLGVNALVSYTATAGAITSITIWIPFVGSGYVVGDVVTPAGGNYDAMIQVTAVSGAGAPTAGTILYGGTGYTSGTSKAAGGAISVPYTWLLSGVLTSNATFIMTPGTYLTQSNQWIFCNNTTGAFTVTVGVAGPGTDAASGGRTVVIPQGTNNSRSVLLQTDGELNTDLCGIVNGADLTVGALQNGMTATTQTAGDNTTKIATDAFVQTAIGGSGAVLWSNLGNAAANLTLANAGHTTTFNQTSAVAWTWANTTVGTVGSTNASPLLELAANYWATGGVTGVDLWTIGTAAIVAGLNGRSNLTFTHTGTTGQAAVQVPLLDIGGTDTGISRLGAASLAIGNGTAGDFSGTLKCATVNATTSYQANGTPGVTQTAIAVGTIATIEGIVTTFTGVSDERLKNHAPYTGGLEEILGITPIRFTYNELGQKFGGWDKDHVYVGFSAQNVQKSIPEAIQGTEGEEEYLSFDDRPVIAAAVNAIKELAAENKELRKRLDALEAR